MLLILKLKLRLSLYYTLIIWHQYNWYLESYIRSGPTSLEFYRILPGPCKSLILIHIYSKDRMLEAYPIKILIYNMIWTRSRKFCKVRKKPDLAYYVGDHFDGVFYTDFQNNLSNFILFIVYYMLRSSLFIAFMFVCVVLVVLFY